ncbi:hypothetical protein ACH5RR_029332 [Cinchona calisaya]|uniref:Uncharacterized protein n=1 Tax=Cinchona calisaya TaxID=153742 RepID=A0ABD2YRC9_9GENT
MGMEKIGYGVGVCNILCIKRVVLCYSLIGQHDEEEKRGFRIGERREGLMKRTSGFDKIEWGGPAQLDEEDWKKELEERKEREDVAELDGDRWGFIAEVERGREEVVEV